MGKEMASYLSFDCPYMHHRRKECGVSCTPERMRPSSGGFGPDGQHGQGSGLWLSERITEDAGDDTASMGGSGGLCICLVCQSLKLVGTMCMRPGGSKTSNLVARG